MGAGAFTPAHRGGSGPPLVCLHGFTATWRAWEYALPMLERRHDVLAPTLAGHAGGPPAPAHLRPGDLADAVERAMDDAGFDTAHVTGNSLGGWVALELAARGRARSVVALAPAGGWADGDDSYRDALAYFTRMQGLVKAAAPNADAIMATPEGRRTAAQDVAVRYEHLSPEFLVHQLLGAAACPAAGPLIELALREGWPLDPARVACPVRFVWGDQDRLLHWPRAAERYRAWFPAADWIVLEDVGHCPQIDVPLETAELVLGVTA